LVASSVWVTNTVSNVTTDFVDGVCNVFLPKAGTYAFTCSDLINGQTYTSEPFNIVIDQDDLSFLNTGIWKALTGGADGNKVWVLDIADVVTTTIDDAGVESNTSVKKSSYFHNPLDFYGEEGIGGNDNGAWGPWGGTSIYDWGGTPENGEITFDGVGGTVKLTVDGVETSGTFTMTNYDRNPNFLTIPAANAGGTDMSLWDYMLEKTGYKSLGSLSSEMGNVAFSDGLRFPMDIGRLTNDDNATNPSQFLDEDLKNVTIMHCSDSGLIVRVKRTYEGDSESKCWLLYNYVVKGYSYSKPSLTHPVKTNLTTADFVGTWKVTAVPIDWISWATKDLISAWADTTALIATGWAATTESLAAAYTVRLTFGADGSCDINGTSTTYTLNQGGYLAFADSVNIPACAITLAGKNMYAVDVASSTDGFWLGQNNGTKEETSAIHFIKEATK